MSNKIDEALAEQDCEQAAKLADELTNLVSEQTTNAVNRAKKCVATRRAAARARHRQRATKQVTPPPSKKSEPTAAQVAEAKKTLDQAWKAYREGYYTLASSLARRVLKTMPNQQALSIVGASACYLKRPKQAQEAYQRLDSQRRQLLRRVCQRMGVPIN